MSLAIQVRLIGGLALALGVYAFWLGKLELDGLPGNYKNPVLALELVAKGEHIDQINRASKKVGNETVTANEFISSQLRKDSGFIVLYVFFFSLLGLLLNRLTSPPWKWVALTGVACAVLAGVLDFVENRGMRKALAFTKGGAPDDLANMIRYPSLGKWGLLFIFSVLIGVIFLWARQPERFNPLVGGLLLTLGGVIGLIGVIANLYKPQFYAMFDRAGEFLALGLLLMAIAFLSVPGRIISNFTN